MNYKVFTQLLVLLTLSTTATAQQLYLETGKTSSTFDYSNSQGTSLDNLQSTAHSFLAAGYRGQVFAKDLFGSLGVSYAGYGAIGSDDATGVFMEWNMDYLEFNAGLEYELLTFDKIKFFIKGTASAGFMLEGTQTLNNKVIDLKNNEDFDKTRFDFRGGVGLSYSVSDKLAIYMQYMYGKSLELKDEGDNESLKIESRNISFGLLISLPE